MKRIKEVIIVEGKTDSDVIHQYYDVDIIETHGLNIDDLEYIKELSLTRDIIIFTDPDYPGQKIRQTIQNAVPKAKHAFIEKKDVLGDKKIGVAESRPEAIIQALESAVTFDNESHTLSWEDFLDLGIIGHKERREYLYHYYHLGHGNNKTLYKRMNMMSLKKSEIEETLKNFNRHENEGR